MSKKAKKPMIISANPRGLQRAPKFDVKMALLKAVYAIDQDATDEAFEAVKVELKKVRRKYLLGKLLMLREEIRGG